MDRSKFPIGNKQQKVSTSSSSSTFGGKPLGRTSFGAPLLHALSSLVRPISDKKTKEPFIVSKGTTSTTPKAAVFSSSLAIAPNTKLTERSITLQSGATASIDTPLTITPGIDADLTQLIQLISNPDFHSKDYTVLLGLISKMLCSLPIRTSTTTLPEMVKTALIYRLQRIPEDQLKKIFENALSQRSSITKYAETNSALFEDVSNGKIAKGTFSKIIDSLFNNIDVVMMERFQREE